MVSFSWQTRMELPSAWDYNWTLKYFEPLIIKLHRNCIGHFEQIDMATHTFQLAFACRSISRVWIHCKRFICHLFWDKLYLNLSRNSKLPRFIINGTMRKQIVCNGFRFVFKSTKKFIEVKSGLMFWLIDNYFLFLLNYTMIGFVVINNVVAATGKHVFK